MTARSSRPSRRVFFALLGLCLAVKAAFVVALADVFFYGEELEKGTAAKAMLDGIGVEHFRLAYHYYEGGGFVISHLKALCFLLVGENVLAHKLAALVVVALVFSAGWRFMGRHFGGRAAIAFALLFTFGPESFQKLSLLSLGIHFESTLFLLLVFDATLALAFDEGKQPVGTRAIFLLGVVAGFGIYFSYQVALVVGFAGLVLLARRRDIVLGKPALFGLAGLAIGLAPFLWMVANVGSAVFDIHGTGLTEDAAQGTVSSVSAFLGSIYGGDASMVGAAIFYPAAVFVAVLVLTRSQRRRQALFLTGFCLFWMTVYLSSAFTVGEIYHDFLFLRFSPVWMVGTVLVAGALGVGLQAPSRRRVATCCLALLLGLGMSSTWRAIYAGSPSSPIENLRVLASTKGYDYQGYFAKLIGHLEGEELERMRVLMQFDEPSRRLLYMDIASSSFKAPGVTDEHVRGCFTALDAGNSADFALGLGPYTARRAKWDLRKALDVALAVEGAFGESLLQGVGRFGIDHATTPGEIEAEIASMMNREGAGPYFRGVGYRLLRRFVVGPRSGVYFAMKPEAAREFLRRQGAPAPSSHKPKVPEEVVLELLAGFDEAVREHSLP